MATLLQEDMKWEDKVSLSDTVMKVKEQFFSTDSTHYVLSSYTEVILGPLFLLSLGFSLVSNKCVDDGCVISNLVCLCLQQVGQKLQTT